MNFISIGRVQGKKMWDITVWENRTLNRYPRLAPMIGVFTLYWFMLWCVFFSPMGFRTFLILRLAPREEKKRIYQMLDHGRDKSMGELQGKVYKGMSMLAQEVLQ